MSIISFDEVAKQYNNLIADYLKNGYIIYPTNTVSFGDVLCYTDLMNLKDKSTITRIWLFNDTVEYSTYNSYTMIKTINIRIMRYNMVERKSSTGKKMLVLPVSMYLEAIKNAKTIYEKIYYSIGNDHSRIYTDIIDELNKINKIRETRIGARIKSNEVRSIDINKLTPNFIDSIMSRINSISGFKRATSACITRVSIGKCYNGRLGAEITYSYKEKSGRISLM
jgi:hypothetical protein